LTAIVRNLSSETTTQETETETRTERENKATYMAMKLQWLWRIGCSAVSRRHTIWTSPLRRFLPCLMIAPPLPSSPPRLSPPFPFPVDGEDSRAEAASGLAVAALARGRGGAAAPSPEAARPAAVSSRSLATPRGLVRRGRRPARPWGRVMWPWPRAPRRRRCRRGAEGATQLLPPAEALWPAAGLPWWPSPWSRLGERIAGARESRVWERRRRRGNRNQREADLQPYAHGRSREGGGGGGRSKEYGPSDMVE